MGKFRRAAPRPTSRQPGSAQTPLLRRSLSRKSLRQGALRSGQAARRHGLLALRSDDELAAMARARGVDLAIVPGDRVEDLRLDEASNLPSADLRRLWRYFEEGGPENLLGCLQFIARRLGAATPAPEPRPVAPFGFRSGEVEAKVGDAPRALILFYRSAYLSNDMAPLEALEKALAARGMATTSVYVASLKDPNVQKPLSDLLKRRRFDVVLNATAFSARVDDGGAALDAADAPVLQVVLAGSTLAEWRGATRGLGAADLAMNVVLPEIDGRIMTRAISFKEETRRSERLEFTRIAHAPLDDRIAYVADLACAWARLRRKPPRERRLACILSTDRFTLPTILRCQRK